MPVRKASQYRLGRYGKRAIALVASCAPAKITSHPLSDSCHRLRRRHTEDLLRNVFEAVSSLRNGRKPEPILIQEFAPPFPLQNSSKISFRKFPPVEGGE